MNNYVTADAASIDYSVRVPPSLRVTFRGRDGEVVVERYLGESAEAAVARACRAAKASPDECSDLQSAFACKVSPSPDCEAAQARKDAEPARLERLRRLSTLAALGGAVAIAYFQHRAAQAGGNCFFCGCYYALPREPLERALRHLPAYQFPLRMRTTKNAARHPFVSSIVRPRGDRRAYAASLCWQVASQQSVPAHLMHRGVVG